MHFRPKWFFPEQRKHVLPYAGYSSFLSRCFVPQNLHSLSMVPARGSVLSLWTSSGLSWEFMALPCRLAFSAARHVSTHFVKLRSLTFNSSVWCCCLGFPRLSCHVSSSLCSCHKSHMFCSDFLSLSRNFQTFLPLLVFFD